MTITIAEVPIAVTSGSAEVTMQIREPGTVHLASLVLQERLLTARGQPEYDEQLVLFVEIDPKAPLRNRKFIVIQPGQGFTPKEGFVAQYAATARSERTGTMVHVFEVKQVE